MCSGWRVHWPRDKEVGRERETRREREGKHAIASAASPEQLHEYAHCAAAVG